MCICQLLDSFHSRVILKGQSTLYINSALVAEHWGHFRGCPWMVVYQTPEAPGNVLIYYALFSPVKTSDSSHVFNTQSLKMTVPSVFHLPIVSFKSSVHDYLAFFSSFFFPFVPQKSLPISILSFLTSPPSAHGPCFCTCDCAVSLSMLPGLSDPVLPILSSAG